MGWTKPQKGIAVRACRAAGIDDEARALILGQIPDHRATHQGRITSTSPKLTNWDFEFFMAHVESFAGGQILHYSKHYWHNQSKSGLSRLRHKAETLARRLEAAGFLEKNGEGLRGWIKSRVTRGLSSDLNSLDIDGLHALIEGLKAFIERKGVETSD